MAGCCAQQLEYMEVSAASAEKGICHALGALNQVMDQEGYPDT